MKNTASKRLLARKQKAKKYLSLLEKIGSLKEQSKLMELQTVVQQHQIEKFSKEIEEMKLQGNIPGNEGDR